MIRCVCQVYGCADLTEVPNAALRRHGNTVVVKCHYNGQTYLLTCVNNRWNGDPANCSKGMYFFYDTLNLISKLAAVRFQSCRVIGGFSRRRADGTRADSVLYVFWKGDLDGCHSR